MGEQERKNIMPSFLYLCKLGRKRVLFFRPQRPDSLISKADSPVILLCSVLITRVLVKYWYSVDKKKIHSNGAHFLIKTEKCIFNYSSASHHLSVINYYVIVFCTDGKIGVINEVMDICSSLISATPY